MFDHQNPSDEAFDAMTGYPMPPPAELPVDPGVAAWEQRESAKAALAGTTNADRPFERGEIVEFCGERFLVVENYGSEGSCREWPLSESERFTVNMRWVFEGEPCRRTGERFPTIERARPIMENMNG